ncbi:MAG: YfdX family protein [Thermodesulfobacteria bacterium]|nr:YfdX family protein [Thermodesulfobacteriota bacterium]
MFYVKGAKAAIATLVMTLSLLLFLTPVNGVALAKEAGSQANKSGMKTSAEVSKGAVEKEKKKAEDIKKELNKKAVEAVANTYKVLELLNQNKSKEALDLLKNVIGELEVVLAANKEVALVPINTYTVVVDTEMDAKQIAAALKDVKRLLNEGDVQAARRLLNTLQSEIDIVTENLPLATYPDAMKLASKYIVDGKIEQAKSVISIALNSMVVKTIVIPLPLVRASDLIAEASKVAKKDKEQALKYLDEAEKQLNIAKILGYGKGDPEVYKDFEKRIEAIKKEIKGKNKAEKMFEEILQKLKEFKKKLAASH